MLKASAYDERAPRLSPAARAPGKRSLVAPDAASALLHCGVRVALNAQLLSFARSYRSGGISRVIYHLLRELRSQEGADRFEAFVPNLPQDGDLAPTDRFALVPSRLPTERPAARIVWEQTVQPFELLRRRVDVHHSLSYALPLAWPGRSVLTIYDLSFIRFPHLFNRGNRLYKTALTRLSARRANAIVTISAHGKREVETLLGIPPERIVVAYPAVDERFRPLPREEVERFRTRLGLPEHFILFLGTLEPRKNAIALVRAYAALRQQSALPHHLVLAGGEGWQASPLFALVEQLGLRDRVLFPGFVDPAEQVLWYNAAAVFAYPSLYEGFGLPPLEAMACGVPVVTSDRASLPEVVGDAGRMVDPDDAQQLAATLAEVLSDAALWAAMSATGVARARSFTWSAMARQISRVYHSVSLGAVP